MPDQPASKFADAPSYMSCEVVAARLCAEHRVFGAGELAVDVPGGHWLVIPADGEPYAASMDVFRAQHLPVEGVDGCFVTRGRPFRAVTARGRVHVEGDFETRGIDGFVPTHARILPSGKVACHGSMPLSMQRVLLEGHPDMGGHGVPLAAWRERLSARSIADPSLRVEIDMHDIHAAKAKDTVNDFMASLQGGLAPEGVLATEGGGGLREGSVLDTLASSAGIPPEFLTEVRHMPAYRTEGFRAIGRRLLSPFLGDQPMETALVSAIAGGTPHPLEGWAMEGELVSSEPGQTLPEMPGYVTTDMRHYRRDGVDVLCFEDAQGGYAYCWESPEAPTPSP